VLADALKGREISCLYRDSNHDSSAIRPYSTLNYQNLKKCKILDHNYAEIVNDNVWFPNDEESNARRRTDLKVTRVVDVGRHWPNQDI